MFTNCQETQAKRALRALNLEHHFDGIFGADLMAEVSKPDELAFERMMSHFGISKDDKCVFFEDSLVNLDSAVSVFNMLPVFVANGKECHREGWTVVRGELDLENVSDSASAELLALLKDFCAPVGDS